MNILVPFDMSKAAQAALKYAIWLAKNTKSKISVLHALPDIFIAPELPMMMPDDEMVKKSKKQINEVVKRICNNNDYNIKDKDIDVAIGGPVALILAREMQKIDLIVMGTHDKESLLEKILGSVSNSVIKMSKVPVVLIHKDSKYPVRFKKVLFAIDEVTNINNALDSFRELNNILKAKVEFVYFGKSKSKIEPQMERIITKYYGEESLDFSFEFKSFDFEKPLSEIDAIIKQNKYDMMVMVKNTNGVLDNYFSPSFSIKGVHNTMIPALIYKSK